MLEFGGDKKTLTPHDALLYLVLRPPQLAADFVTNPRKRALADIASEHGLRQLSSRLAVEQSNIQALIKHDNRIRGQTSPMDAIFTVGFSVSVSALLGFAITRLKRT